MAGPSQPSTLPVRPTTLGEAAQLRTAQAAGVQGLATAAAAVHAAFATRGSAVGLADAQVHPGSWHTCCAAPCCGLAAGCAAWDIASCKQSRSRSWCCWSAHSACERPGNVDVLQLRHRLLCHTEPRGHRCKHMPAAAQCFVAGADVLQLHSSLFEPQVLSRPSLQAQP